MTTSKNLNKEFNSNYFRSSCYQLESMERTCYMSVRLRERFGKAYHLFKKSQKDLCNFLTSHHHVYLTKCGVSKYFSNQSLEFTLETFAGRCCTNELIKILLSSSFLNFSCKHSRKKTVGFDRNFFSLRWVSKPD